MPDGPGVRVDAGIEADTPLPSEYDPLLAKLLVHAADRPSAIARLRRSLDEMLVGGVQTDAGFHRWLVDEPRFANGDHDTGLIDELWRPRPPDDAEAAPAAVAALAGREAQGAAWPTDTPMPAVRAEDAGWARQARAEGLRR